MGHRENFGTRDPVPGGAFGEPRPPTLTSTLYGRIKRDIIFGALAPGEKLKLETLKSRYGASLPTLRETLSRLASDGFVDAPAQRGFLVPEVSRADLIEIAELRVLLETHALASSLANGDTEWEAGLVAAHHRLKVMEDRMRRNEDADKEVWKRHDWEFHLALIAACGSRNLLSLHATVFDKYLRYQMLVLSDRGEVAAEEHREMLGAALARRSDACQQMLRAHVQNGLDHVLGAME